MRRLRKSFKISRQLQLNFAKMRSDATSAVSVYQCYFKDCNNNYDASNLDGFFLRNTPRSYYTIVSLGFNLKANYCKLQN